jgi:hypothetical protein
LPAQRERTHRERDPPRTRDNPIVEPSVPAEAASEWHHLRSADARTSIAPTRDEPAPEPCLTGAEHHGTRGRLDGDQRRVQHDFAFVVGCATRANDSWRLASAGVDDRRRRATALGDHVCAHRIDAHDRPGPRAHDANSHGWCERRACTSVAYTVTGGEGDPGGPNEASCMLSGICFVKAVDGVTYKSAQAIGTVVVP